MLGSDPGFSAPLGLIGVQEISRVELGWHQERFGKWTVLSHKADEAWRGTGVAYDSLVWSIMRRLDSARATWFRLRHIHQGFEVRLGSLYLPPHLATGDMQQGFQEFLHRLPATTLPVYVTGDTNAVIKWSQNGPPPFAMDSKRRVLLDGLMQEGMRLVPPQPAKLHQATSRPRKDPSSGRAIDWIVCKRVAAGELQIVTDSCFDLGTDHDCLVMRTMFRQTKTRQERIRSGKRVVVSTPLLEGRIDQPTLRQLADTHTTKPRAPGYKDSVETKRLFRRAKTSRDPADWKTALRSRWDGVKQWREEKVQQAIGGDWQALPECKPDETAGWESALAESLQPDPHQKLHQHYEAIFDGPDIEERLSYDPPHSPDITAEELSHALSKGKGGRV